MDDGQPKKARGNLLIVDDDLPARQTLEALMTQEGYEVRCAPNGETALIFAQEDPPELILLDVRLPDVDGFQVCRRLKEDHQTAHIPVIFISALDEVVDKVKGFDTGGVDYITKPFQAGEVLARVETHLGLRRLQRQIETQNRLLEQEIIRSKEAEKKIKKAAEEWRTTFDSISELVSIHDGDFRILRANKAYAAVFGKEIRELLGKKCYEIIHGTEEPWPSCPHRQTLESGKTVTEEFFEPLLGKYLQVSASPIFNDQNEVVGSVHIAKDITEHKRAEEALQRAHDELEERVKIRTADLARANEQLVASGKTLEERLQFERLLSDLSARFVMIPPDQVDPEIEHGLRQVLEFFQVDRVGLVETFPDKNSFQITHAAIAEGVPPVPVRQKFPVSIYPWAYDKLIRKGEVVAYSRLDDLPPEADVDKQTWTEWGVRSNLNIPIMVSEPVDYIIAINSMKREHVWPEEFIPRLQLLGEIFENALERKRIRLQIEERLRFETLISNLSAGFVNLPPDEVGSEINKELRSISEFFDADRCTIGLFSEDGTRLTGAYEYHSAETERGPEFLSKEQMPWYFEQLIRGNPVVMNRPEDLPSEAGKERQLCLNKGMKSILSIPMVSGDKTLGSCVLVATRTERVWPKELVQRFRLVTEVFVSALQRRQMEEQAKERLQEIENLKQRLEKENVFLQEEVKLLVEHTEIVGQSLAMKKILAQAEQVAGTDSTVILLGETGTGKELLARAIHGMSSRRDRPLVTVNCASLPPTLIESELFGRERGAYTGALTRMVGRFEIADGSTLFLDEIGELPIELQSKLLRVLEEGNFERLGSTKTLHVNVRIIAATNRDIAQDVKEGKFRKDLYYRLNVFPIQIPPLRERPEDIPLMAWAFVREFQKKMGKRIDSIPKKSMEALQAYSWPGNARELRNVIERAIIVSNGRVLNVPMPSVPAGDASQDRNLGDIERRHILNVLERTAWRLTGKGGAAEALGLKRTTLQSKMKRLGIKRPTS